MREMEVPLGFGIALGQDDRAMKKFSSLTDKEKQLVIDRAHFISTQYEMKSFVRSLVDSTGF